MNYASGRPELRHYDIIQVIEDLHKIPTSIFNPTIFYLSCAVVHEDPDINIISSADSDAFSAKISIFIILFYFCLNDNIL